MSTSKRLYKNPNNKVIAGVCSGLADYFDVDVVLMRLIVLALVIFTGIVPGLLFYVIAAIIMPVEEQNG